MRVESPTMNSCAVGSVYSDHAAPPELSLPAKVAMPEGYYHGVISDMYINPDKNPNRVIIKVTIQEAKPPVFDAFDQAALCADVLAGAVTGLKVHAARCAAAVADPALLATDLADYLVKITKYGVNIVDGKTDKYPTTGYKINEAQMKFMGLVLARKRSPAPWCVRNGGNGPEKNSRSHCARLRVEPERVCARRRPPRTTTDAAPA